MAFSWTPQQIRWYENASDYGSFHRELASILAPYLGPDDLVCDWGCGLGRLSLELAPSVSRILCVDHEPLALQALGRQAEKRGIKNLRVVEADAKSCGLVCDVGLMSFFGTPYELMRRLMGRSRRLLIRIMKAGRTGGETASHIENCLRGEGRVYEKMEKELEFGQALTSLDDARQYLSFHEPEIAKRAMDPYLRANLRETDSKEYPYYLGKKKKLVIYIIDTSPLA